MNNLARSLGVPLDIEDACALIGMGTVRHIDAGRVISNRQARVEYFLEGAGVGLSALAAYAGTVVVPRPIAAASTARVLTMTRIEGGTNNISRTIFVADNGMARLTALRSSPAGSGFLRLVFFSAATAACAVM
jgi:hypothetical protein